MDLHQIIELSLMHKGTDYSDSSKVIGANKIADQIGSLIDAFIDSGEIEQLVGLINHSSAGSWVAFKLAESEEASEKQKEKSISRIRKISKGNCSQAIGAEYWLIENGYTDS